MTRWTPTPAERERIRGLRERGLGWFRIAEILNAPATALQAACREPRTQPGRGAFWTDDEVLLLMRMIAEGKKRREMAAALGKSVNAILGKRHRLREDGEL